MTCFAVAGRSGRTAPTSDDASDDARGCLGAAASGLDFSPARPGGAPPEPDGGDRRCRDGLAARQAGRAGSCGARLVNDSHFDGLCDHQPVRLVGGLARRRKSVICAA